MENTYYIQLVTTTQDYLGPAAERFIQRQISFHLEKNPDDLTKDDVLRLSKWVTTALARLTNDEQAVTAAQQRILNIANN